MNCLRPCLSLFQRESAYHQVYNFHDAMNQGFATFMMQLIMGYVQRCWKKLFKFLSISFADDPLQKLFSGLQSWLLWKIIEYQTQLFVFRRFFLLTMSVFIGESYIKEISFFLGVRAIKLKNFIIELDVHSSKMLFIDGSLKILVEISSLFFCMIDRFFHVWYLVNLENFYS